MNIIYRLLSQDRSNASLQSSDKSHELVIQPRTQALVRGCPSLQYLHFWLRFVAMTYPTKSNKSEFVRRAA